MVSKLDKWLAEKTDSLPKWLQTYIVLITCAGLFVLAPMLIVAPIVLIASGHVVSCILLTVFVSGPVIILLLMGDDDD